MAEDKVVCYCVGVKESEIKQAVANGASTVDSVELETGASSVCGSCKDTIEEIIKNESK